MALRSQRHPCLCVAVAVPFPALRCKTQGTLENIREENEEEQVVYVSPGINDITTGTQFTSVRCPTSATVDSPSLGPDDYNHPSSPAESFVTEDIDDNNSNVSEEEDEEYFIFAGRGDDQDHDDQMILSSSRSFFGVEDFVDEDNSRPYTYKKEKRSKNPHKHISFKQRTIAYMEPFTLDVFISKRFVSASLTHRSTCRQVAVAGTNSKDIKAVLQSRSDIPACLAVGRFLAERAKEADVYTCTYTPRERDKFEGKIRAVVQSLIDNGINDPLRLVTHCVWNSVMEAACAGVPLATSPLRAEQFLNKAFLVEVASEADREALLPADAVARAVGRLMGDAEDDVARRASELGAAARAAVAEGGSSCRDWACLVDELMALYGHKNGAPPSDN
ncbi:hypothetical protein EJB05_04803, partial [Eragrostis curvula]